MKYGKIAETPRVNARIYDCFEHLCEEDKPKFMKKFSKKPRGQDDRMNTFMELILGAFLASKGLMVRYEHEVDGQTPDWCILDDKSSLLGVIELTNFHIDRETENAQNRVIDAGWMWWGYEQPNNARLFDRIRDKAEKYDALATRHNVPYVVSVFSHFRAAVKTGDVRKCLFEDYSGLFNLCPRLSGVLFFEESWGQYRFEYIRNPHAVIGIDLPLGVF